MFSFQFHNLPPLNKRCYMLSSDSLKAYWVVSNSISGIMFPVDWLENITYQFSKVCEFWSVWCRERFFLLIRVRFWFQINDYHSLEKTAHFIHRHGATIYKAQGFESRKKKVLTNKTENHGKLCVYFVVVQIVPFIYRTSSVCQRGVQGHSWEETDFACGSSVQWCSSHQWAITWIIVQSLGVRWHSNGWNAYGTQKMHLCTILQWAQPLIFPGKKKILMI